VLLVVMTLPVGEAVEPTLRSLRSRLGLSCSDFVGEAVEKNAYMQVVLCDVWFT
jgi:hypothetical protein